MTFEKIGLQDDECECLSETIQDSSNQYTRKIFKPSPKEKDFLTKWEKGYRTDDCKTLCENIKSLSINQWNNETKNDVLKKYVKMFTLRKGEDSAFVFIFNAMSGKIKPSPRDNDNSHYDYFKSDQFDISLLTHIETIILSETQIYKDLVNRNNGKDC
jgi:hypothetical protein